MVIIIKKQRTDFSKTSFDREDLYHPRPDGWDIFVLHRFRGEKTHIFAYDIKDHDIYSICAPDSFYPTSPTEGKEEHFSISGQWQLRHQEEVEDKRGGRGGVMITIPDRFVIFSSSYCYYDNNTKEEEIEICERCLELCKINAIDEMGWKQIIAEELKKLKEQEPEEG